MGRVKEFGLRNADYPQIQVHLTWPGEAVVRVWFGTGTAAVEELSFAIPVESANRSLTRSERSFCKQFFWLWSYPAAHYCRNFGVVLLELERKEDRSWVP
ncbi:hypothetical protein R1flu_021302 [Riccia fluitans]|uniref:Uncharacterized protein n=1 Tax=Riccia fluitans TaxID=41844 RepID=A0ABD1ZNZ3_9MARC